MAMQKNSLSVTVKNHVHRQITKPNLDKKRTQVDPTKVKNERKTLAYLENGEPNLSDRYTLRHVISSMEKRPENRLDEDIKLLLPLIMNNKINTAGITKQMMTTAMNQSKFCTKTAKEQKK